MRLVFYFFLFCCSLSAYSKGQKYYFTSGSVPTSNTGKSPDLPWQFTSTRFNSLRATLSDGDTLFFRRGDVFTISALNAYVANQYAETGTQARPVVFTSYGDPALPKAVFSGFQNVKNLVSGTTNSWQPYVNAQGQVVPNIYFIPKNTSSPRFLVKNGVPQPLGRFPNFNVANAGALKIPTPTSKSGSIYHYKNTGLFNGPNWRGSEVVHMPRTWIYARYPVVFHDPAQDSISFNIGTNYAAEPGAGFFFLNHVNALDLEGEWAYDATNLYIYSSVDPNNLDLICSNSSLGFDFNGANQTNTCVGVTFQNLGFQGFNSTSIRIRDGYKISHFVSILDCDFSFCHNGLDVLIYSDGLIARNTFRDMTNNGIIASGIRMVVEDNVISRISIDPGRCETNNNNSLGISFTGVDGICRFNRVDSTGFNSIRFEGQRLVIEKNILSNFTINKNDGGGIYSFNGFYTGPKSPFLNYQYGENIIQQNIIRDGHANYTLYSLKGVSVVGINRSTGLYSDDNSVFNYFLKNVIYRVDGYGILFNWGKHSDHHEASGNIIFNLPYAKAFAPFLDDSTDFKYVENVMMESVPFHTISQDNIFNSITLPEKGKSNFNSFLRFDFNNDSTLFRSTSGGIFFKSRKEYYTDSSSTWISIQPQIKNPVYGPQLIQNGDFNSGQSNWTFTRNNLSTTAMVASTTINSALVGNYLLVNTTGGSFTAVNKFFQLSQTVAFDANALYELEFSTYFDFSPCGTPIPGMTSFPIEILVGNKLSTTFARVVNVFPNKVNYKVYIIPTSSGNLPLSIACTLPCRTKYYFDNFSLKKIANYSTNIEEYTYFQVNETKSDIIHVLPTLPTGWYYLNPKNKTIVQGTINLPSFSALLLIKTNRKLTSTQRAQAIVK